MTRRREQHVGQGFAVDSLPPAEDSVRRMMDGLPMMVCAINTEGTIAFWNRECEQVSGYAAEDVVGNPAAMQFLCSDPNQREQVSTKWREQGDNGHSWRWDLAHKDGTVRITRWSSMSALFPIRGWAAWAIGVDVTRQDPGRDQLGNVRAELETQVEERTAELRAANRRLRQEAAERIRAQEATDQAQRQFENIIDNAYASIVLKDLEGRYILANRRAAWLLHLSKDQMVGKTDYDLLPKATADLFRANDLKALESKTPFETEDVVELEGLPYTYLTLKFPLRDAAGKPYAVCTIATDITNRKRAEDRLRFLSSAVEQSSEGIAVVDLQGNLLFVNEAFARMHGYTSAELLGRHLSVFHTPDQMPAVEAANRCVHETGEFTGEVWHARRDGTVFPTAMHNTLLRDAAGHGIGIIGALRDVTERWRAEEAVKESERKYRELVENANSIILRMDPEGRITFFNEYAQKLFGYTEEEILGRKSLGTIVPETESSGRDLGRVFTEILSHPNGYETHENENIAKDGRRIWVAWTNRAIRDADGRVVELLCIGNDVTERRRMEEALRVSEANYRRLFDFHPAACFAYDREGAIRMWNREAERLYGYSAQEVIGRKIAEAFGSSGEDARATAAMIDRVFKGESVSGLEWMDITASGERRWVLTNTFPIQDAKGEVVLGISSNIDITERREAEQALRESQRALATLMSNLPGMAYRCRNDQHWTMEFVSEGCFDLTGYHPHDLIGNTEIAYSQLIHPDDREAVWDAVQVALATREPYRMVYRIVTATGEEKWVWEQGRGVYSTEDAVLALEGLVTDITERRRAEESIRSIVEGTAGTVGADFFRSLVRNLASALKVRYAFVGELFGKEKDRVRTLAVWAGDHFEKNIEYALAGTPCENVVGQMIRHYSHGARERFPQDHLLVEMGVESYMGVPLFSSSREPLGLVVVMHDQPMSEGPNAESILAIFAARAGAELERKRADESLEESEARFRTVTENALTGVYIMQAGRFLYVNPAFAQMFGYSQDHIEQSLGPLDLVRPEDRALVAENIRRRMEGEVVALHYIFRGLRKDGGTVYCEALGRRIQYRGHPAVIGTLVDVTERRRAEDALRDSEARTRAILNTAADAIVTADERGTIESCNPAAERMFGYAPLEIIGRNLAVLMPEPYASRHNEHMADYLKTGVAKVIGIGRETVARRKDGTVFPIDLSVAEVHIGERRLFTGIIRDITDRKRAEQALRESEERNRMILDHMQEAVIFADAHDVIRHINECACSLLNTTREHVVGKELLSVHPEAVHSRVAEIVRTFREGQSQHVITVRRALGDREVIFRFSPVRGPDGDYWGIITNIIDITEQARMQQHLAEARRMEAIGTLAGGVAHDFNNLMATVLGCASHLKARRRPDHPDYEGLAQIENAADTAGRLAHQLLVYAKGGKILPRLTHFADVVNRALQIFRPSLPANVRFHCRIADDLARVECDTTQVEQVIVNLCRNAVDAMARGGTLTLRAMNETHTTELEDSHPPLAAGDYVCLAVEDTGSGMDPETAKRVFDPFFTTKANGYGLGLAAAYGTVKSHGGAIALTTQLGVGTTFRIWLPQAKSDEG